MSEEIEARGPSDVDLFELDQRRATAYAKSGYWPDAAEMAKALVKVEAGRSLGLPPIMAMSELHVIEGKPQLGAGALSALVKASGRYDYRVEELDDDHCALNFFDVRTGEFLGTSTFTMADAERAKLKGRGAWATYPRNMLFARAISNGVAWFCPDVTLGRIYSGDEIADTGDVAELPLSNSGGPSEITHVDEGAAPVPPEPPDEYFYQPQDVTRRQIDRIKALLEAKGVSDPFEQLSLVEKQIDRDLTALEELGQAEATAVIAELHEASGSAAGT